MTTTHSERLSVSEMLAQWIASFPFDIKILLDIANDRRLDTPKRALAVGVLGYILTPIDVLPDKLRSLGLIDDVIMLRLALAAIWEEGSDWRDLYAEMHPGVMTTLDEDVAFLERALGTTCDSIRQLTLHQAQRLYRDTAPVQVVYSDDLIEYLFTDATKFAARLRADSVSPMRTLARFSPQEIVRLLEAGLREEVRRAGKLAQYSQGATYL